ncbi:MAG: hypothetical protein RLZZ387_1643 [Chloroflexota bacterium]|jgi:hypothetical protein
MLESIPGLLLASTIVLTLFLLPYLNEERRERTGLTEEIHVRRDLPAGRPNDHEGGGV